MNPDDSPFTPNQPVEPSGFVGREAQINNLVAVVRQSRKSLKIAWIGGERGIGKSSLASFVGFVAERDCNALVGHVHLGNADDLEALVKQSYLDLIKDNQTKSTGRNLLDLFENRVEQFGLFGVDIRLRFPENEVSVDSRGFVESLDKLRKKADKDKEMVLLILDDINGLAKLPVFADWIKNMVDGMATRQMEIPMCLIFVGLPECLESIRGNNPSVVRTFSDIVNIEPWTEGETKDFFSKAFDKKGVEVDAEVLGVFARNSGGLPTVAHAIGEQAWRLIEDKKLAIGGALQAVTKAALLIGERFIEKEVEQALRSENYKSILSKISTGRDAVGTTFSRQELFLMESLTSSEKKAVDNFLQRMIQVGGLLSEGRGEYRFPTALHRLYFFLTANPPTQ